MNRAYKKRANNIEFLTHLMDFARTGPLMQAFIIEAISQYAEDVIAADLSSWEKSMISPHAWKACAIEFTQAREQHLSAEGYTVYSRDEEE